MTNVSTSLRGRIESSRMMQRISSKADGLIRENDELHANLKRYIEKQQKYTENASLGEASGGNIMHSSLPGADSEAYFELTEMADVLKKANSVQRSRLRYVANTFVLVFTI